MKHNGLFRNLERINGFCSDIDAWLGDGDYIPELLCYEAGPVAGVQRSFTILASTVH